MATPLPTMSVQTPRPFMNYFFWPQSATSHLFPEVSLPRGLASLKPSTQLNARRSCFRILCQTPLFDPFWITTWLPALQAHPLVWWVPPPLCWPLGDHACLQLSLPPLPVLTRPFRLCHPNILTPTKALPPSMDQILAAILPLGVPSNLLWGVSIALGGVGGFC